MAAPNFKIDVTRNGQQLKVASGSFTRSGSESNIKWQIVTVGPIDNLNIETDTFSLSFTVAGKSWYRFKACTADGVSSQDQSSQVGDTISGTYQLVDSDLLNLSCPVTLCFANTDWIANTFGPTMIKNGVLMTKPPGGHKGGRCIHARLPGKEFLEGTFEVIPLSGASHHSVARYLCDLVGLNLIVTTPDIPLVDTFTVSSGTSWMDAIKANFGIWSPDIRLDAAVGGARPILHILDVINSSSAGSTTAPIQISNAAIDSVQHSRDARGRTMNQVDHVIVIGRAGPGNAITEDPDFTPRKIPELNLSPNFERSTDMDMSDILAYKKMGEYVGDFGTGEDLFSISQVKKMICVYKYYRYYDQKGDIQYKLLEQSNDTIDKNGNVVARHKVETRYGEGFVPVRTIEREYILTNMPGTTVKQLKNIRNKHTFQDYMIKALNQAQTREFTEELVVHDQLVKAGQAYKDNPNPMANLKRTDRTRTAIDKTKNTTQATIPMTTKFKWTFIGRTSDSTLEKREVDFDVLTATARLASQILQNPKPAEQTAKGATFRREYFSGTGVKVGRFQCYKKTVTIKHDDICTDDIAKELADRQFYRRNSDVVDMTVKTSVPVPLGILPVAATVSPIVKSTSAGATVTTAPAPLVPTSATTVPGGTFYVYEVEERFATSRDVSSTDVQFEQTLKMRSRL